VAQLLLEIAIRWGSIAPLYLTALAVMGSPGPATISLTAAGSAFGIRPSLGYLSGIVAGTWIVLAAVALGVTGALLTLPGLRPVLVGLAAAYILWLAYHIARAPIAAAGANEPAPAARGGLLLGVANPKAWVAIAAVFATARIASTAAADAAAKVALLTPLVVFVNAAWLVAGASLAPLLSHPRRGRALNVTLAVALVAATVAAAVPEVR
jgi:threonine/homoserine/homoserine lactone efflux protein